MGVYIANMSKPITCEECPFADSIGAFMPHTCGLTNITLADDFARMDCPLIEIDQDLVDFVTGKEVKL